LKAREFRYIRPASLAQALEALAQSSGDAVALAGGQSLLTAMNMRLSAPSLLVDIGELEELKGIAERDGVLLIGAGMTHASILEHPLVRRRIPLLVEVGQHIAHVAVRNRGTIGGSLAYSDPAAEWPAAMVALQAELVLASCEGERRINAEDFFIGLLETALRPGELILRVEIPIPDADVRWCFDELARRHGNFALAGLFASAKLDGAKLISPRVVYLGCTDYPKPAQQLMAGLNGVELPLSDEQQKRLVELMRADVAPHDIPGLRGETRFKMAVALTTRVINSLARQQ
jgi:carbon-monoxide dehydrogenase medium subunit